MDGAFRESGWGFNTDGELGNSLNVQSSVPVAVTIAGTPMAGMTLSQISAHSSFACALGTLGLAYCWGYGLNGQLGNNSTASSNVPVAVTVTGVLAGVTLTQIGAGSVFACGLSSTGAAYCWGTNGSGELGNNSTTQSLVPVAVTTSGCWRARP